MKTYFVYIMASQSKVIYVGLTNNLVKRVWEHKTGIFEGFTKKYRINRLVYFDQTNQVSTALEFEKKIKGWTRKKKVALIEKKNPFWRDLYVADYF